MKGTLKESISYHHASYPTLRDFVKHKQDGRDDVIAVSVALDKSKKINLKSWVLKSGKLKFEDLDKYEQVFSDGLLEVEDFLKKEKVI